MRKYLAIGLLLSSGAMAHGYKSVKDWVGGCDNTRHCSALGLAKADAESYALLHFERGPAAGDEVRSIRIRVDQGISREQTWTLHADDAELLQFTDRHLVDADSGPGLDFVMEDTAELAALMGAMRSAELLTVMGKDGPVGSISLAGASAIMLWIDEQQGRLATTTALVRRGEKSPQTVPPAVPLPVLSGNGAQALGPEDASALGATTRASLPPDSCEELLPDSNMRDEAWQFDNDRTLLQLHCFRGAYNFGSSWFLIDQRGEVRPLSFPIPNEDGSLGSSTEQINADFDANTGRLHSFNKGRGLGDCGSSAQWQWDGQAFQLAHYRTMGECRGVSPDLWPRLWLSKP